MLRWYLGDEVFFEAIQNYLAKYKHSNVNAQDLIDEFNAASGQNLDWFFQQWVFGKGFPQLTIKGNYSKYNNSDLGFYQLTIEQVQNESYGLYKALPVEITFKGKSGESFRRVFTLNEKQESFRLDDLEEIESISANTFETIRGLFRVNQITSDVNEETKDGISASIESGILSIGGVNLEEINGVSLYSYQGKKYLSLDNYSSPINLSNFPKGVYFVVLHFDGEEIVKKISL